MVRLIFILLFLNVSVLENDASSQPKIFLFFRQGGRRALIRVKLHNIPQSGRSNPKLVPPSNGFSSYKLFAIVSTKVGYHCFIDTMILLCWGIFLIFLFNAENEGLIFQNLSLWSKICIVIAM